MAHHSQQWRQQRMTGNMIQQQDCRAGTLSTWCRTIWLYVPPSTTIFWTSMRGPSMMASFVPSSRRIGWMSYITCFCMSRSVLAILMWRKKQHHMQEYWSIEMVAWSGASGKSGHSSLTILFILHNIKHSSWCHMSPGDHITYFRMKL